MTKLAASLWKRATEALEAARHVLSISTDAAAERAVFGQLLRGHLVPEFTHNA